MKFHYKKFSDQFVRPIIPVDFSFAEVTLRYEVLVDSGADYSILPADIGEALGLEVETGREEYVGGITGGGLPFFLHSVTLGMGDWKYEVDVGFMPDMPRLGYGVVGQRGFFELFRVTFDQRKAEIRLEPY